MKILQIHKYCSRKKGGGSVTAFFETIDLLKEKGHQVEVFSMHDPENEQFSGENFAQHFDVDRQTNFRRKLQLAFRSIFNREAQKSLEKFLDNFQPEIAHIHNIYHYLTPSIFFTLKKRHIPMVFKLSDYKLVCPNYKLFSRGKICQKCRGGKYYHCFLNRCLKNSFSVSFVAMLEAYLHRFLKSYNNIDLFLAPSLFMKKKCEEFGIPSEKIEVLRNTVNQKNFSLVENESKHLTGVKDKYFLFYGRLSEEKGVARLLEAVSFLKKKKQLFGRQLWIVGQGPQEKELRLRIRQKNLESVVKLVGFQQNEKLKKIVREADFVIVPSIWLDNSPLVISESQLLGKPVLVSALGGSPEMIIDQKTGLIFDPFSLDDFSEKLIAMLKFSPEKLKEMGLAGRKNILQLNDPENYYQKLMNFYQRVINNYQ